MSLVLFTALAVWLGPSAVYSACCALAKLETLSLVDLWTLNPKSYDASDDVCHDERTTHLEHS